MKRSAVLLFLLVAWPAWASQPPSLKLPDKVSGDPGDFITVKADTNGTTVKWVSLDKGLKLFPADLLKDTKTAIVIGSKEGTYRLLAYTATGDQPSEPAICTITIGTAPEPGPTPPGPDPGPTPNPDPFMGSHGARAPPGFRCLMVYEASDLGKYPDAQRQVLYSDLVRSYLRSKCIKADGTPDYRVFDKDTDLANEDPIWSKVMKLERKSLPWIVIGNGKNGFSGPLPADVDATLSLLKKYGGA